MNKHKILVLKIVYIIYFAAAAFLVVLSGYQPGKPIGYQTGQVLAIWALSGLALQFLLSSRLPLLEKGVGHDRLMRWHHFNGKLITIFVTIHPVLNYFWTVLRNYSPLEVVQKMTIYHWYGEIAFDLIIVTVLIAIFSKRLGLSYETWRWVHRIVYVIIALGFWHSYNIGSDIYSGTWLWYWWLGLLGLVCVSILYRNLGRLLRRRTYHVSEIFEENYNVHTLRLKPTSGSKVAHMPGQFAFITLHSKDLPVQEHPFTIVAAPEDPYLGFSIKASGDFTGMLDKVQIGDRVDVEAPYGVFTNIGFTGPLVFIAGGIGVTPFMSMIRSMVHRGVTQPILLLWANQTEKDIVFKNELEVLVSTNDWLKVVHILAEEKEGYEHGRIDSEKLKKYVTDFSAPTFFVCGPPPMMKAIEQQLHALGVQAANIITEKFSLN